MLSVQLNLRRGDFQLDVSFESGTSEVIALFGRSGSGKSTTAHLLAGLLHADAGRVVLDDEVLCDTRLGINLPPEQRRIGYVFQNARLFPHYTVAGNLRYGLQRSRAAPAAALSFDNITALLGLAPLLQRRPWQLSGGEQQRVALGRALLAQPRLLLLDEPLASLDQQRRDEVLPWLEAVRDQLRLPMVYVSHQFDEVLRLASTVVLLEDGHCIAAGDLATVSRHPTLRRIVGPEAIGAVIEAEVVSTERTAGLATLGVGSGQLQVSAGGLQIGQRVRLQLLARDLILALQPPVGLSVRNRLPGTVVALAPDDDHAMLVTVDVGGPLLLVRITALSAGELHLHTGLALWVLVKTVTLRGHLFRHSGNQP